MKILYTSNMANMFHKHATVTIIYVFINMSLQSQYT